MVSRCCFCASSSCRRRRDAGACLLVTAVSGGPSTGERRPGAAEVHGRSAFVSCEFSISVCLRGERCPSLNPVVELGPIR